MHDTYKTILRSKELMDVITDHSDAHPPWVIKELLLVATRFLLPATDVEKYGTWLFSRSCSDKDASAKFAVLRTNMEESNAFKVALAREAAAEAAAAERAKKESEAGHNASSVGDSSVGLGSTNPIALGFGHVSGHLGQRSGEFNFLSFLCYV